MSTFTDKLVNAINPEEQISNLLEYTDNVSEANKAIVAESVGLPITGAGAATGEAVVALLNQLKDATYAAFAVGDAQRWIRVAGSANGNDGWYLITKQVSATIVEVTPSFVAPEATLVWQMYREPNLQDDINIAITQLREIINPAADWFQPMPRGFDPANTSGADAKNEKMSLKVLADNWLGSKTEILDIITDPFAAATSDTGKLYLTAVSYADPADRRGLVIQKSVANAGAYFDEVTLASIVKGKMKVMLEDAVNGDEFFDSTGNIIYGVLEDGEDHSGTGEGTDVFIKYVHDVAGVPTAYTWTAANPTSIKAYLPQRKKASEMLEYDRRRAFVSSIVGDAETHEDIANLWSALGLADSEKAGDWDITNLTNYYILATLATGGVLNSSVTMEDIVNALNDQIGNRLYSANNVVTDGQSITASIEALDLAISGAGIKTKILERRTASLSRGTVHAVPFATGSNPAITTYKLDTGYFGRYLSIYVGGKKLIPDSSATAADGEYAETSTTQVTFRFTIAAGQVIEYVVTDDV